MAVYSYKSKNPNNAFETLTKVDYGVFRSSMFAERKHLSCFYRDYKTIILILGLIKMESKKATTWNILTLRSSVDNKQPLSLFYPL